MDFLIIRRPQRVSPLPNKAARIPSSFEPIGRWLPYTGGTRLRVAAGIVARGIGPHRRRPEPPTAFAIMFRSPHRGKD